MKTITAMLEDVMGPNLIARSRLPASIHRHVMRLQPGERRVAHRRGWKIVREGHEDAELIPTDFDVNKLCIINNMIDRCMVGGAGMNHFMTLMCCGTRWGPLHDSWNAIKTSAKRAHKGRIWSALVRFSGVANLPFGPFRSTAWKSQLQEALRSLTETLSPTSPEFERAMERQQALQPHRFADQSPGRGQTCAAGT